MNKNINLFLTIPNNVKIILSNHKVIVIGKNGELNHYFHKFLNVKFTDNKLIFILKNNFSYLFPILGTTRSIINNMMIGVTQGFSKKLQLVGVGYRVVLNNNIISLSLGFSHNINYKLPDGVTAKCLNSTEIELKSLDKQLLGQTAADIRNYRLPDHYKGKGIRYFNEVIHLKETKKK